MTRIVLSIEERIARCLSSKSHSQRGVRGRASSPLPTRVVLTITDIDRISPRTGKPPVALARHQKVAPD